MSQTRTERLLHHDTNIDNWNKWNSTSSLSRTSAHGVAGTSTARASLLDAPRVERGLCSSSKWVGGEEGALIDYLPGGTSRARSDDVRFRDLGTSLCSLRERRRASPLLLRLRSSAWLGGQLLNGCRDGL